MANAHDIDTKIGGVIGVAAQSFKDETEAHYQMYLNCGSWRRVHELARFNLRERGFMGYREMTFFAFYKDGEQKGRPFEVWSGTLGVR